MKSKIKTGDLNGSIADFFCFCLLVQCAHRNFVSSKINGILVIRHVCNIEFFNSFSLLGNEYNHCSFLLLLLNDLEVVVYEGVVREKPSSKEEARRFIKGLLSILCSTNCCFHFPMVRCFTYKDCRLFWQAMCHSEFCSCHKP